MHKDQYFCGLLVSFCLSFFVILLGYSFVLILCSCLCFLGVFLFLFQVFCLVVSFERRNKIELKLAGYDLGGIGGG